MCRENSKAKPCEEVSQEELCCKDQHDEIEDIIDMAYEGDFNVEELMKEKAALEGELADLKRQYEALYSEAARIKADFHNYKRRTESNIERLRNSALTEIMLELLPVVDNFERALICEEGKDTPLYKGVSMIYRQLLSVMEKFDMVPIKSIGEAFDPSLHEAVAVEEISDTELDGKIVKEIQRGYVLKGEVIRPAKVIVGKLTDETEEEVGKDE